jgi:hypothetical protein
MARLPVGWGQISVGMPEFLWVGERCLWDGQSACGLGGPVCLWGGQSACGLARVPTGGQCACDYGGLRDRVPVVGKRDCGFVGWPMGLRIGQSACGWPGCLQVRNCDCGLARVAIKWPGSLVWPEYLCPAWLEGLWVGQDGCG